MRSVYIFAKGGYDGAAFGNVVYLSKNKAELELLKYQENENSPYYNHPLDDFYWYVGELDFDEEIY